MKKLSVINKQFLEAAKNKQLDDLKNLLSQGVAIHADNDEAFRWAARRGQLETVKFLVTQGANIHAVNDYALRWSAKNDHLETVKFLIAQGADIHAYDDEALRWAAWHGQLKTVKFLLTQGANIHANDGEALKSSVRWERDDVWQVLSAFIQEEKLLVAASESTGASTWVCGTSASCCLRGMPQTQPVKLKKSLRSKI